MTKMHITEKIKRMKSSLMIIFIWALYFWKGKPDYVFIQRDITENAVL